MDKEENITIDLIKKRLEHVEKELYSYQKKCTELEKENKQLVDALNLSRTLYTVYRDAYKEKLIR